MLGRHRPASKMPYEWCFAGGPMIAPLSGNLLTPSDKTFWIRAWFV